MTSVSSGMLIDTNLLVYMYDPRDRIKQAVSIDLVNALIARNQAILSVQCLSEFYRAVTGRIPERMTPTEALTRVTRLTENCRVLAITPAVVLEGCRGAAQHQISIWDGLIWAVAKLNQVSFVLTEDAQHGLLREGVQYLNPFSSNFDLQF